MSRFAKKSERSETGGATLVGVVAESCKSAYPILLEYMSTTEFDDGAPRETSTVTFFVEHGSIKACLKDREEGCVAFVTGDSFEAVLDALEASLGAGDLDWRYQRQANNRGRGRKR